MSGIVGSKFNHRGSGLVGSLGTDGQHMLSSGAGKTNVFETVAAAGVTAAQGTAIRHDILVLALKQAVQENSTKFNLTNAAVCKFEADADYNASGSTTITRDATEYISSKAMTMATNWTAVDLNQSPWNSGGGQETAGVTTEDWINTDDQASWIGNLGTATSLSVGTGPPDTFNRIALGTAVSTSLQFGSDKDWEFLQLCKCRAATSVGVFCGLTGNSALSGDGSTYAAISTSAVSQSKASQTVDGPHGTLDVPSGTTGYSVGISGTFNSQVMNSFYDQTATAISGLTNSSGIYDNSEEAGFYAIRYVYDGGNATVVDRLQYDMAYPNNDTTATLGLQSIGGDLSTGGYILPTSGYPGITLGHYGGSSVITGMQLWYKLGTTAVSATGTALGTTNVPTSAITAVSGVMLLKHAYGSNSLGTDVKVYFTADNSNWTEADSYTDAGTFSTGIKMIKLGKTTVTSGSDVRWKIAFANQSASSKEAYIYGIGLNY